MISSQIVMTVGPMIVRTRDASVGSPTAAWITPAAMEKNPASRAVHPSHLAYTALRRTASPNRMNVTPANTRLNRLAKAKLIVSFA
jgi:hypothetical protein